MKKMVQEAKGNMPTIAPCSSYENEKKLGIIPLMTRLQNADFSHSNAFTASG